jgi:hypothetical protein
MRSVRRSHVRQGVLGGRLEVFADWRKDELIILRS